MKILKIPFTFLALILSAALILKPSDEKCYARVENVVRDRSVEYMGRVNIEINPEYVVYRPKNDAPVTNSNITESQKQQLIDDQVKRVLSRIKVTDHVFYKKITGKHLKNERVVGFGALNMACVKF